MSYRLEYRLEYQWAAFRVKAAAHGLAEDRFVIATVTGLRSS